jgi:hypothetical protein
MESDFAFEPDETFAEVSEILESLELSGGWQIIEIQQGVTFKQRKDIDNDDIFAAETFLGRSVEEVLEAVVEFDVRAKWDLFFKYAETLESWGKNLKLIHLVQKYKWPLYDRDFVLIQGVAKDLGERVTIGWKSVKYDKLPLNSSLVRARIVFSGFVVTKVDDSTSHVSFYEKSYPNVSVPDFMERKMQIRSTEIVMNLKNYLMRDKL